MLHRLLLTGTIFFLAIISNAQTRRFSFSQQKMGSPLSIIFYDNDSMHAVNAAGDCFKLVDSFVNIFSDYIDTSELNLLCTTAGKNIYANVSPALYDILVESQRAYKLSQNVFDISIAPLSRLWRKSRRENYFPSDSSIRHMQSLVGFKNIIIDTILRKVKLLTPGMQLDLGGIAQGYIAGKLIERLYDWSISKALVDVSGDIAMSGSPPGKNGWSIGINLPGKPDALQKEKLILHDCTASTSGDAYQYIEHNGKRYSHIIDPRTGYGVTSQKNVTVISSNSTTADWLATACSILGVRQSKKLARKMDAEVLIAQEKNGQIKVDATRRFKFHYQ
ncbi:MAG: FAD:protein transferase [Chitinophagaceae bacterium]|nr:FAD:protein transferase [Chitinophagaceae bacterium]